MRCLPVNLALFFLVQGFMPGSGLQHVYGCVIIQKRRAAACALPQMGGMPMGLFSDPNEAVRKENLKKLEDKRLEFALRMEQEGFAPEKMLFAQTENGGFVAISIFEGQRCLIISPGFGTDENFALELQETLKVRCEEVRVKSEGLAGAFGLGKRGEIGMEFFIERVDGSEVKLPLVAGRNSWMECARDRNPLLKTKRRRGNSNVVWEMRPIEKNQVQSLICLAEQYLGLAPVD